MPREELVAALMRISTTRDIYKNLKLSPAGAACESHLPSCCFFFSAAAVAAPVTTSTSTSIYVLVVLGMIACSQSSQQPNSPKPHMHMR